MKDKINIAELLKDCPKGMELYSPIFGKVYLDKIRPHLAIVVTTDKEQGDFKEEFLYDGRYGMNGECMLFPSKGKTTWEGFRMPFKDGDVVCYSDCIAIFKEWGDETLFRTYVTAYLHGDSTIDVAIPLFGKSIRREARLATEEEKERLFQAIKDNGYRWNAETKTLEKLIKPKFKVGDRIRHKCPEFRGERTITNCDDTGYFTTINDWISIKHQDDWELVPNKFDITTLKPFDKVLTRVTTGDVWGTDFFGYYKNGLFHCNGRTEFSYCIPFVRNEHLLGTTDDCDEYFKIWKN